MKNYTILFLILTALTGLIGFAGLSFRGIEFVRITFLIFADILVISVLAKLFFANSRKMKMERIRK